MREVARREYRTITGLATLSIVKYIRDQYPDLAGKIGEVKEVQV